MTEIKEILESEVKAISQKFYLKTAIGAGEIKIITLIVGKIIKSVCNTIKYDEIPKKWRKQPYDLYTENKTVKNKITTEKLWYKIR